MSSLHRSAIGARLAKLPPIPPPEDVDEDEEEEARSSLGSLPSTMSPPLDVPSSRRKVQSRDLSEYTPISASGYFVQAVSVSTSVLDFRVYYTPPVAEDRGTIMVCHHGAGYSGLSFACFAKEVSEQSRGECGVLSFDARRHGKTVPRDAADDTDLSVDTLTTDLTDLLVTLFPNPSEAPSFLLVGHSMGGAVCVRSCRGLLEKKYRIAGVAVLDVVEGSAIDALPHMMNLLNSRPDGFQSLEEAVHWHISNNTIRNVTSARISIPPIFKLSTDPNSPFAWHWRTPLRSTSPYWTSWFTGLSSEFLAARTARLLVLAGTDRLDKELMIGQMQGKFQLEVVPDVGHMLHEDNPARLAEILVEFWRRNERVVIAGIKKVGET